MNPLQRLDEGLWTIDFDHAMFGAQVGTRSTVVRLRSGGLWIGSPGPFDEGQLASIRALGPVEALVAPNTFHHVYLSRAKELFPDARVFLAPGLKEKVPTLPPGETLGDEVPGPWSGTLEQTLIEGTSTNEVVFFHPMSRTLILTDLAFNLRKGGLWTRLAMSLNGGFGRFGPTKVMMGTVRDQQAFRGSIERLFGWDFDRVILAHGDIVESNGIDAMAQAFGVTPVAEVPPRTGTAR